MKLQNKSYDCESQRVAKLEEKLFAMMERVAQLEDENAQLRDEIIQLRAENVRLQQQLAAARKNSSTSSKPPSSDIVKPKKTTATRVPPGKHAQNLAKRFRKHGEAYFQFITTPGIEPTNNLAEQAIRFVVIDRRITQGTRSETGRRWCERIWTVIATCAQQGRSVFEFLLASVESHLRGATPPSLMPSGP